MFKNGYVKELDGVNKVICVDEAIRVLTQYKSDYASWLEALDVYPETAYSRPYLYVARDSDGDIIVGSYNERMALQYLDVDVDDILHEIDVPPTTEEWVLLLSKIK